MFEICTFFSIYLLYLYLTCLCSSRNKSKTNSIRATGYSTQNTENRERRGKNRSKKMLVGQVNTRNGSEEERSRRKAQQGRRTRTRRVVCELDKVEERFYFLNGYDDQERRPIALFRLSTSLGAADGDFPYQKTFFIVCRHMDVTWYIRLFFEHEKGGGGESTLTLITSSERS